MDRIQKEAWQNFIAGDSFAFKLIYENQIDGLFDYGCRYTPDHALIKDCIQDLFVELNHYRSSLSPEVNVKAYLFTSLRRKLFNQIQKSPNTVDIEDVRFTPFFSIDTNAEIRIIEKEQSNELVRRLNLELKKLTSKQQEVLYLKFNAELSYDEIAKAMQISVPTCRTLVYRAIKQLRIKMESSSMLVLFSIFISL